jgi:hypothetical protein
MNVRFILELERALKEELWRHLLRENSHREEAAFLFCKKEIVGEKRMVFSILDSELLQRADFAAQHADHLELSDSARVRIIKRAHVLEACLVEVHSHPWRFPAEFSAYDRAGLRETVPHMRWRLKERPYLAVVVAVTSYDALVWALDGRQPEPLSIRVDGEQLTPTGLSVGGWDE